MMISINAFFFLVSYCLIISELNFIMEMLYMFMHKEMPSKIKKILMKNHFSTASFHLTLLHVSELINTASALYTF